MSGKFLNKCEIQENSQIGRYVKASKAIKTGETLLVEPPILILATNGDKRCCNCFKYAQTYCSKCHISPLCLNCLKHNDFDCSKLASMSELKLQELRKYPECYDIIKCLLLSENPECKEYFEKILKLESHLDKRRNTQIWQDYNKKIIQPILNSNITKHFQLSIKINEEFLQHLCGILDVNTYEIRAPDLSSMSALYLNGSLLAHQCNPNANVAIDDQYRIKIYANRDIEKDEMVTNCYTNVLLATDERRRMLQQGKYFHCTCNRCEDSTELGSYMSSLLCQNCRKGYMVKNQIENKWFCQECIHQQTSEDIECIIEKLQNDILQTNMELYDLEMLLQKLLKILHPQHYMVVDVKQNIASMLRNIINDISCCPGRKVYERKIDLCKDIFNVLNIIVPGISRLKAIVLYEWASTCAEYNRLRYQEKDLNKIDLKALLQESEQMLRDSIRMLVYEPKETPEGKLMQTMMQELKYLQTDVKMLK